ncbi:MAG: flavodoxin family protein [Coriobacteriales bacterium]|jgi:multimeric flavodoxin WrbA|nr:flavodoxin family protein [Coriobacteriales bacterium]
MKTLVVVDGGPRKGWNTARMLDKLAQGAAASGAQVQSFRLYELDYKGCVSCFACKRAGVLLDVCAQHDGLRPVLKAIRDCDAFVVGSPIYFGDVTGLTRAFIERVCFPYISYDNQPSHFGRYIKTSLIYTTNAPEAQYGETGYRELFEHNRQLFARLFGETSDLTASETLQFDDYSNYAAGRFDAKERLRRHETVFLEDLKKAYELGATLVK